MKPARKFLFALITLWLATQPVHAACPGQPSLSDQARIAECKAEMEWLHCSSVPTGSFIKNHFRNCEAEGKPHSGISLYRGIGSAAKQEILAALRFLPELAENTSQSLQAASQESELKHQRAQVCANSPDCLKFIAQAADPKTHPEILKLTQSKNPQEVEQLIDFISRKNFAEEQIKKQKAVAEEMDFLHHLPYKNLSEAQVQTLFLREHPEAAKTLGVTVRSAPPDLAAQSQHLLQRWLCVNEVEQGKVDEVFLSLFAVGKSFELVGDAFKLENGVRVEQVAADIDSLELLRYKPADESVVIADSNVIIALRDNGKITAGNNVTLDFLARLRQKRWEESLLESVKHNDTASFTALVPPEHSMKIGATPATLQELSGRADFGKALKAVDHPVAVKAAPEIKAHADYIKEYLKKFDLGGKAQPPAAGASAADTVLEKGANDRNIVTEAFLAAVKGGRTPAFITADRKVYNALYRIANGNSKFSGAVYQLAPNGFDVTITVPALPGVPASAPSSYTLRVYAVPKAVAPPP